ncbi:hypothetical protein AB0M32_29840 [Streptomyces sp. NPDC051985]|uniref:hypothetical protein n=1 Tax=Streptomyces sp. NPDC051985 TaxID=3155807 RepID=UPI003441CD3B
MSDRCTLILLACGLMTLVGVLIAAAAGYLARRDNASYPAALARAAIAFTATLTLTSVLVTTFTTLARC